VGPGADVNGCLDVDESLHGVLEDAPKHVGVSAVEVVEQRLLCHLFWAIVGFLGW
jgi:hypothetical protein